MSKPANAGHSYNGVELTDGLLDSLAKDYETENWSGHVGEIHTGKPRFGEERLIPVTIKIAPSKLAEIDQLAADRDETRSETIRQVIDKGLAAAS